VVRWAYKWSRELARRMESFRGEYAPAHPAFPNGSRAACITKVTGPLDLSAPDIESVHFPILSSSIH
jgi:alcohol oxidase